MKKVLSIALLFLLLGFTTERAEAQQLQKQLRTAAKSFKEKKYDEAKRIYQTILKADSSVPHSYYGLGSSQYMLEEYDEALNSLIKAAENRLLPAKERAELMHNIGNTCMKKKDYHKSVAAYKQSLRLNPQDDETRYNLALAMKLARNQEDDSSNEGQSPNPSESPAQLREVDRVKDPKETRHSDSQALSKEATDKILDAYEEDERKTREKVERMKQNQSKNKNDKNKKRW